MKNKQLNYKFSTKKEVMDIIKLMGEVDSLDIRSRFYLVTLGYKSIDVQNFTLDEANNLINDPDVPQFIANTIKDSLDKRKSNIEKYGLKKDTKYLFVNFENNKIHDCILLRDWRRFLKENDLDDINIQIFRQSINYINLCERYEANKEKDMEEVK